MSYTPYAAPVIFVPQRFDDEGKPKMRMCIDYRALNKITIKDRFPLPHPEDLLSKLHGMHRFTKLVFWSGFHQHRCHPDTIEKNAFIGPDAFYEWLAMPFGAANAPSDFMRLMARLLEHIDKGYCIVFIDDILIYSKMTRTMSAMLRQSWIQSARPAFTYRDPSAFLAGLPPPFLASTLAGTTQTALESACLMRR